MSDPKQVMDPKQAMDPKQVMDPVPAMDPIERLEWKLRRRKLSRAGFWCLMLFYGLAIFAPLLAGDRPYALKAINYRAFHSALRTLLPVASSVEELVHNGPSGHRGRLSWSEALNAEWEAGMQRVELLRTALPGRSGEGIELYAKSLDGAVGLAIGGQLDHAEQQAALAKQQAEELRFSLRTFDPAKPEEGGFVLVPQTSYPLLETISGLECFFMLLWCALFFRGLWNPIWNRWFYRNQLSLIRASRWSKFRWCIGLCASLALLFGATLGGSAAFERAPYKDALDSGELVAEWVLFPPLTFGFAESHLGEIHRPPTWTAGAMRTLGGSSVDWDLEPEQEFAPRVPVEVRFGEPALNSIWRHPLGTDARGRDLLVRLLWGARISLAVGLIAALLVLLIGTLIGALAGYFGGRTDFWISRSIEVVQCFPAFFLILLVLAFWDLRSLPPIFAIVLVMALVRWTGVARLARAEFLRLRAVPYALAARAAGVSHLGTIFRHLLPNAIGPILVAATFLVASGILTESALSFLGFGVQEPIPSWGSLINDSRSAEHWWIQLFPGLCIFLTVVSYNLLGEALRDALDPKERS